MSAETTTGKLIANLPRACDSIGKEFPILGRAVGEVRYGNPAFIYCITYHGSKIPAGGAPERMYLTSSPHCDSRCQSRQRTGSQ